MNQIERADHLHGSLLLKHSKSKHLDSIPFSVKYNPAMQNIKEIINKQWNILSINSGFKKTVNNIQTVIAFDKRTSLKHLTETNTKNKQKFLTPTLTKTKSKLICPMLQQSTILLYKHPKQRDLCNFSPSHLS